MPRMYMQMQRRKIRKKDTDPSRPTGDKKASQLAQDVKKTHFFRGEGNLGKEKRE